MKPWVTLLLPYAIAGADGAASLAIKSSNVYVHLAALVMLAIVAHYNRNQEKPS